MSVSLRTLVYSALLPVFVKVHSLVLLAYRILSQKLTQLTKKNRIKREKTFEYNALDVNARKKYW